MVLDREPVWPEMQRETGDRSQDREMTDIGWEQEKLHWLSLLAPPPGQHLKMAALTDTEGLHFHVQGRFVLITLHKLTTFLSRGGMSPPVCSLCWSCRAQERGRGRLDRLELGPGVCQDSGEGAGQGGGSVHGPLMPSLTSSASCSPLVTLGCHRLRCTLGAHCPLISVSLSHTALPRCSELQLTALCPH